MRRLTQILALVLLAMLSILTLIGCAAVPAATSQPATSVPPAASATPVDAPLPTAPVPVSGSQSGQPSPGPVVSTPAGVGTSGGPGTGAPSPVPSDTPGGALTITRANNGQTLDLHVGDRFVLLLGEEYNWTLDISDQTVLHRVVNITPIRGSQGVFEALRPGAAKLTAAGDPPCRQATPPCGQPSYSFELNVTVVP